MRCLSPIFLSFPIPCVGRESGSDICAAGLSDAPPRTLRLLEDSNKFRSVRDQILASRTSNALNLILLDPNGHGLPAALRTGQHLIGGRSAG